MMILNASYRGPLTYSNEVVAQSERALERLRSALRSALRPASSTAATASPEALQGLEAALSAARQGFLDAMDDDFNTAGALGSLFDLVRAINQARDSGVGPVELGQAQAVLVELTGVLGLNLQRPPAAAGEAAPFIELLVELRKELRANKLWALSDLVRNRLLELNVLLEDSKEGTTWRWK
jgi:cysteinyl-tRNA synthetase